MQDLRDSGVDVITLGQYLQPTKNTSLSSDSSTPTNSPSSKEAGYEMGFDYVESGPLVRSSYHSDRHVIPGYGRSEWLRTKEMTASIIP